MVVVVCVVLLLMIIIIMMIVLLRLPIDEPRHQPRSQFTPTGNLAMTKGVVVVGR
jgi:hypothetical protein